MIAARPIPRRLLPDTMEVRVPTEDGGFDDGMIIEHVRFERTQSICLDDHCSADAGAGVVYVDVTNSTGAFEVPAGSRVCIDGADMVVASCKRLYTVNGHVHHWELEVR